MERIWNKPRRAEQSPPKDNKLPTGQVLRGRPKVFVAMSGGVDSSVAALLLQNKGYEIVGCHMLCWEGCDSQNDRHDAMRVAAQLNISFLVWDFRKEYREKVFEYMVRGYAAGRTPNPDVMCNKEIKFGIFLKKALGEGADFVATGHYVRKVGGRLLEAKDKNKDQGYFLWTLTQKKLKRCLFPVGDYLKSEIREMAEKADLATAKKKDSQGLCFVGKVAMREFLKNFIPQKRGDALNEAGRVIGYHEGARFYTPGQRRGFTITEKGAREAAYYVIAKDVKRNTLTVSHRMPEGVLSGARRDVSVKNVHWIAGRAPTRPAGYSARIRYRQPLEPCTIASVEGEKAVFAFKKPQSAVTPGQSLVLYDGEVCLGGGIIA